MTSFAMRMIFCRGICRNTSVTSTTCSCFMYARTWYAVRPSDSNPATHFPVNRRSTVIAAWPRYSGTYAKSFLERSTT